MVKNNELNAAPKSGGDRPKKVEPNYPDWATLKTIWSGVIKQAPEDGVPMPVAHAMRAFALDVRRMADALEAIAMNTQQRS